jgi:hypothetical protein
MATLVRFKSILAGSYGTDSELYSAYRSQFSGDGGATMDFNAQRVSFVDKLYTDLVTGKYNAFGFTAAKVVANSSVTARIGVQIIFNPAGTGGEYVNKNSSTGIAINSNPFELIQQAQYGNWNTVAYTTTAQIIALGVSGFASTFGQNVTKLPLFFTDGNTMGMIVSPIIQFRSAENIYPDLVYPRGGGPESGAYNIAYVSDWWNTTVDGYFVSNEGEPYYDSTGSSDTIANQDGLDYGPVINTSGGLVFTWTPSETYCPQLRNVFQGISNADNGNIYCN